MTVICTVSGCSRTRVYRETCKAHYRRLRASGSVGSGQIRVKLPLSGFCSVDPCEEIPVAKGLCAAHYRRASLYGNPIGKPVRRSDLEKFFDHVTFTADCWLWSGMKRKGYGRFAFPKRTTYVSAHRWLFEIVVGRVPDGFELDHLCRTPACVNPDHLEAVTHSENLRRALPYRTSHPGATPEETTEGQEEK